MITDKFKTDLFQKIADDALKPMSIITIKEKFNLSFPFKVKRVRDTTGNGHFKGVTTIKEIFKKDVNAYPTRAKAARYVTNNHSGGPYGSWQSAEFEDYILSENY